MIDGVIDVCTNCGGTVQVPRDLVNAHRSETEDRFALPYHIVWSHNCGVTSETAISGRTLNSIRDHSAVLGGKMDDSLRRLSEDEELLIEFATILFTTKTLADIGWKVEDV